MYRDPDIADGKTVGLKPYFYILNTMIRATLTPKAGDATTLQSISRNVLDRFADGVGLGFSVTHLIWTELQIAANDAKRSLPYAPYLMYMIEQVSGKRFFKEVQHFSL